MIRVNLILGPGAGQMPKPRCDSMFYEMPRIGESVEYEYWDDKDREDGAVHGRWKIARGRVIDIIHPTSGMQPSLILNYFKES